jgi:metal-responsive CopG/Arc/MetJ family transcriptional regulator
METKRRIPVTFYETLENISKIEHFARKEGVSISEYVRKAVQVQIEAEETDEAILNKRNEGRK